MSEVATNQGALTNSTTTTSETCRAAITKYWPKDLQATAITILTHENRLESPTAVNTANADGSVDRGCSQINSIHKGWVDLGRLFDPDYNEQVAYQIYKTQGISAWSSLKGIMW